MEKTSVSYLAFNLKNYAKVKDVRVRQAISLAIDRNKIVNEILFGAGAPATGYLPELALGYNKNAPVLEYNPEKAKNLLAQAGYKSGLELELWYIRPIGIETALQAMLKDVGINLILKQLDAGVVKEAQNNGTIPMNLTYFAYSYSSPEPDGHFIYLDPENGGKHFAIFYNNENLKKLYRQGRTEQNETKRIEIYRKINEEILNVDLPVIPIHYDKRFYMINSRVKANILPVNIDFADADISE